jgi:hypothetical protein
MIEKPAHLDNGVPPCSDCQEFDRRGFLGAMAQGAAVVGGLATGGLTLNNTAWGAEEKKAAAKAGKAAKAAAKSGKAEDLIRELVGTLSSDQKADVIYPWDHGAAGGVPTRLRMVNSAHFDKDIADTYTKPQQELCLKILKAMVSDDEGYRRISRGGDFDGSGSFEGLGAHLFGDPTDGGKFSFVFSGHHLTVRCDGNSEPATAFGGPMYYGHSVHGYNPNNVFFYQTKGVLEVYGALDEKQRQAATITGKTPGEQYKSVEFRAKGQPHPGVAYADLSSDQKELVEKVMRDILSPYRKEDADEVLTIVKETGGMDKMHLAFYADAKADQKAPWHFWRLEGPGFVWNYRVLPHVHTFVQIANKA